MTPEKEKSNEAPSISKSGILSRTRMLALIVLLAVLAKADIAEPDKEKNNGSEKPDIRRVDKSYLIPEEYIDEEDKIIICEELDSPDAGQAEPEQTDEELYKIVVEALRLKNNKPLRKRKRKRARARN